MVEKKYPRLLIISNNALSFSVQNGITLESFVREWDPKKIAQLFFKEDIPASESCRNFFKITDHDILRLATKKTHSIGTVITLQPEAEQEQQQTIELENKLVGALKLWPTSKLIRELMWSRNHWCRKNLLQWLNQFKPEVILFCGGDSIFAYYITRFIADLFHARILFYVTDDYLKPRATLSVSYWIRLIWLRKQFSKMLKKCHSFITIGQKMSNEYEYKFGKKSTVAMNCVELKPYIKKVPKQVIQLTYMGGLHYNRWQSLATLGKALEKINGNGVVAQLEIYTQSKITPKIRGALNRGKSSKIMGSLNKEGVKEKMITSDILVHVEGFDKKSRHATRLSISTKIPEYMASGRCILGVGPEEVASIEYIKPFSFVITNQDIDTIVERLKVLIDDQNLRNQYIDEAYQQAEKNHDIKNMSEKFYKIATDS